MPARPQAGSHNRIHICLALWLRAAPTAAASRAGDSVCPSPGILRAALAPAGVPLLGRRQLHRRRGGHRRTADVLRKLAVVLALRATPCGRVAQLVEPHRQLLLGLRKQIPELWQVVAPLVHEGDRDSLAARAPCSANTVDVIIQLLGHVKIDNQPDVLDVETAGSDVRGNQHGVGARLERLQRLLSLLLRPVAMDRGDGHAGLVEVQLQGVGGPLCLHEYDGEAVLGEMILDSPLQLPKLLLQLARINHMLLHQLRGGTHAAHLNEDIVGEEVLGHDLHLPSKRGRKHHGLAPHPAPRRHACPLHDLPNLGLEAHIQHAIGLIKDEELDQLQRGVAALRHVCEAPRGGNEDVAALLQVVALLAHVGTAVNDTALNAGVVGKLEALHVDLRGQLARGRQHQAAGHGLRAPAGALGRRRAGAEQRLEARDHEGAGLAAARLRARHEVPARHDDGDRVLLHWRRPLVAAAPEVVEEAVHQLGLREARDGLDVLDLVARDGHGDRVVLVEVNARRGLLLRLPEDLELGPLLARGAAAVLAPAPVPAAALLHRGGRAAGRLAVVALRASALALGAPRGPLPLVLEGVEAAAAAVFATGRLRCTSLGALLGWHVRRHGDAEDAGERTTKRRQT
mmetsp:Transcript_103844/g.293674  ORF Transcript_103844/g.293674 Transcript_103844/m.293674 type:complete len:628 (+) Transcript_103844:141-2024(+)